MNTIIEIQKQFDSRIRLYFRKRHDIEWDFSYSAFQFDIAVFLEIQIKVLGTQKCNRERIIKKFDTSKKLPMQKLPMTFITLFLSSQTVFKYQEQFYSQVNYVRSKYFGRLLLLRFCNSSKEQFGSQTTDL